MKAIMFISLSSSNDVESYSDIVWQLELDVIRHITGSYSWRLWSVRIRTSIDFPYLCIFQLRNLSKKIWVAKIIFFL